MVVGTSADKVSDEPSSSVQGSQPCRRFEFHEIQIATENFDESLVIGKGGFGKVYKANVTNGSSVVEAAIKRLDFLSNQGAAEFWAEVETLSMLRHCNLVSLFGYCDQGKEMILVYEYMPTGTLEDHLHKLGTSLSWLQRLKICICAGRGLHYLHTGTGIESGVIHRDVKSSNILLHESWAAKIADFGLSKIGPTNQPSTYVNTLVKGTFGYLDPNYFLTGRLTRKSDVYAFGVVMFEVLCRKRAVDKSLDEEQWGLATWVKESIKEGNLKQIIDSDIRSQISPKCLKEFVRIAERCLHSNPKQRPTMAEALVSLESALILQEKFNNLSERSGRTIFGKIVDMLPFPSNGDNTGINSNKKNEVSDVFVDKIPSIGAIPKAINGEQVAAGWPSWLVAIAGEAIDGWLPRRADTFEKLDKIGEGTYGRMYKGRDIITNKFVALKKARFDNTDPESVKFMAREIHILRRLDHPNIIKLEGLITSHSSCSLYLVFEYMEHDLTGLASLPGVKFTEPQVKCYMKQLLSGLDHCHSRGVLHRDTKGSNLWIDNSGILKLAGFSLATFFDHRENVLLTNRVVTLRYRPPELLLGATKYGVAVDLWSTGCILGELYAGKPIMAGRTEVEQLHAIFKLCGSPSEEYWRNSKLPHSTVFKPTLPYTRRIEESFKNVPPVAIELMETLLAIDPSQRGTALLALKSEFFATKPHACDPSNMPSYPPRKEIDAKQSEKGLRRRRAGGHSQKIDKESLEKREHQAVPAPDANVELVASMQNGNGYKGNNNKIHFPGPWGASSIDQMLKYHEREIQEAVRRARLEKNRLTKLESEVTANPI